MTVAVQTVLRDAMDELADEANVTWTTPELVRYLNAGQRSIGMLRPDQFTVTATLALATGARQSLPAAAIKLVEVHHNTGGKFKAVKLAARELLDAFSSGWYGMRQNTEITHYSYDIREPRAFYVYPPAAAGASLDIAYTTMPADCAVPAPGTALASVTGNITVPDRFADALRHYVLYRCWNKDVEHAQPARAEQHLAMFTAALAMDGQTTVDVGPNSKLSPNANNARTGAPE